jgi:hypothetical protein
VCSEKHILNGATMIPLVITSFGRLGPAAGYLPSLATIACSTAVRCGMWLRGARQHLSCAFVRGRGVEFPHG